ncbi:hypothetical protein Ciccas_006242 [Cichlidogyrus casuarinus]|uniref:Ig-like domain-containing protein n=1 Tax=Cichlidogyrus casuarinus TaxID=1844966 RepID=A0ABD2Q7B7_9PLAT
MEVGLGDTVSLNCTITGNPPPRVVWRWNWRCIPGQAVGESQVPFYGSAPPPPRYSVTYSVNNCEKLPTVLSTLTISNFVPTDAGIFNCDGLLGTNRVLSEDMHVTVRK